MNLHQHQFSPVQIFTEGVTIRGQIIIGELGKYETNWKIENQNGLHVGNVSWPNVERLARSRTKEILKPVLSRSLSAVDVKIILGGSGCGSVGRAFASNSRGPRFEPSHWKKLYWTIQCQLYWKDENKEKEAENGPFKKKHFGIKSRFTKIEKLKNDWAGDSTGSKCKERLQLCKTMVRNCILYSKLTILVVYRTKECFTIFSAGQSPTCLHACFIERVRYVEPN